MDMGAYCQIENLGKIAKANGIDIPRLRGYRLMKDEGPFTKGEIKEMMDQAAIYAVQRLCRAEPFWDPHAICHCYNAYTDYLSNFFLVTEKSEDGRNNFVGIRWDRIHGKKRKILKYAIKKKTRAIKAQYDTWNKYAGKEGVLYAHSRIGGPNWSCYEGDALVAKQPWFLERVDDYFDSTYCDIYCKVKENA